MAQLPDPLLAQLVRVSGDLDLVIRDLQLGPRSRREPQRDHDDVADRVERIAAALRSAVRGPSPRPTAAPIWSDGAGRAAW